MDKNAYTITRTGKKFFMFDPERQEFCIEDIAHALANTCRYNGHTNEFYSVAQHSYAVASILKHKGFGPKIQLAGLLHDAAEAYFGDMISPLKAFFPEYVQVENICIDRVYAWAGIETTQADDHIVKTIDELIRPIEIKKLFPDHWEKFQLSSCGIPLDFELDPVNAETAKLWFTIRFEELREAVNALSEM